MADASTNFATLADIQAMQARCCASDDMSSAFHSSMSATTSVARVVAARALRTQYESVFAMSGPSIVDMTDLIAVQGDALGQPMYWRRVLRDAAEQMVKKCPEESQAAAASSSEEPSEPVTVSYNGQTYEFPRSKRIVLIGVRHGCDIVLTTPGASRLHAVLLLLPQALYVIDMGARSGVRMSAREDHTQRLLTSTLEERCVMKCGPHETVVLQLFSDIVTIHPRICIVCMDRVREVRMDPCHHFVCCSVCANKCKICPQCRSDIVHRRDNFHGAESHAASSAAVAVAGR
jgi:hypothetical protein